MYLLILLIHDSLICSTPQDPLFGPPVSNSPRSRQFRGQLSIDSHYLYQHYDTSSPASPSSLTSPSRRKPRADSKDLRRCHSELGPSGAQRASSRKSLTPQLSIEEEEEHTLVPPPTPQLPVPEGGADVGVGRSRLAHSSPLPKSYQATVQAVAAAAAPTYQPATTRCQGAAPAAPLRQDPGLIALPQPEPEPVIQLQAWQQAVPQARSTSTDASSVCGPKKSLTRTSRFAS